MTEKKELTRHQRKVLKQWQCFAASETLEEAFFMADRGIDLHKSFVHYTTLSRLVQIVTSGRWWLTRCNTDGLNDVQEAKKYGNPELLGRMYQASFAYGSAESAAMWGLYCPGNPFGIMISLGGNAMRDWFSEIRNKKSKFNLEYNKALGKHGRHLELNKRQIDIADARDVIYASTDFGHIVHRRRGSKHRSNSLFWFDMFTNEIEDLEQEINADRFSGWIKDYEWRQENESRIAVRVKNINGKLPDYLSINVTDSVFKSMHITLSPWLREEYYAEVENVVRALFMKMHDEKLPDGLVSRSGLTGALESWRERYCGYLDNLKECKCKHKDAM